MLSAQAATRAVAVSAPTIDAPAVVNTAADQPISIQAVATDADAADILTITESGAPASLTLSHTPSVSPATATLSGSPGVADIGSFNIMWHVSDGTGGSASTTTALTVSPNHEAIVTAPANVPGAETIETTFAVTVSDPDGDPINTLTASSLPAGATFTPNAFHTNGLFDWIPSLGQQGTYPLTFTATSGTPARTASAYTTLQVGPQDHYPVITTIPTGNVTTFINTLTTIQVFASDPDSDAINELTAEGTQGTDLPAGAAFTHNANNTQGTLTWTPTAVQNVGINFIAFSGSLNLKTVQVRRINVIDRAPVVTVPPGATVNESSPLTLNVSASDPDGQPINSLTSSALPFGATFTVNASYTAGTLSWTPDFTQAGVYPVTFTATNLLSGTANAKITVVDQNRPPVADADGPYTGVAGIPLTFNGSGSSDPDGNALTYDWNFGDSNAGTGSNPVHIYSAGGTFNVSLTVTDNGAPPLSNTASTTAQIVAFFDARVFTSSNNKSIRLSSSKPTWCASVEPVNGSFNLPDVLMNTIILTYGAGQISAISGKSAIASDTDKNGIDEIGACFSKTDLRTLFAGLPGGRSTVQVTIEGMLESGAHFAGSLTVDVFGPESELAASLSPNPFNPKAVLTFVTTKPGAVRVRLFDTSGRLVRVLADESNAPAGYHDIQIDGRDQSGMSLSSGVYFYRIDTAEGSVVGRASIVK